MLALSHPLVGWTSAHPRVRAAGRAPGGARASGFAPGLLAVRRAGARGGRQGAAERGLRRPGRGSCVPGSERRSLLGG